MNMRVAAAPMMSHLSRRDGASDDWSALRRSVAFSSTPPSTTSRQRIRTKGRIAALPPAKIAPSPSGSGCARNAWFLGPNKIEIITTAFYSVTRVLWKGTGIYLFHLRICLIPCGRSVDQVGFCQLLSCWCGYLSGARCRLFACGPTDATASPKPRHLLPHLNPNWFYLSGTGLPRLSWKTGRLTGVVVVVVSSG